MRANATRRISVSRSASGCGVSPSLLEPREEERVDRRLAGDRRHGGLADRLERPVLLVLRPLLDPLFRISFCAAVSFLFESGGGISSLSSAR